MNRRGVGVGLTWILIASFFFWLETVLPTPDPSNDYSFIGFPLGFIGIVILIASMRSKGTLPPKQVVREPTPTTARIAARAEESQRMDRSGYKKPTPPKETKAPESEPIRERIITERVLVVCPYCGAKNEQGMLRCRKCSAEI